MEVASSVARRTLNEGFIAKRLRLHHCKSVVDLCAVLTCAKELR